MYAIVEIKSKQYQVEKGSVIAVDKLNEKENSAYSDIKVLLFKNSNQEIIIGKPYLDNVKITAKVQEDIKDKKVLVYKYKKRKGYHKKQGHRQQYTKILITDIKAA